MKKVMFISSMLLCGMMMFGNYVIAQNEDIDAEIARLKKQRELKRLQREIAAEERLGAEMEIPCVAASLDDENYFREYGKGTNADAQEAREQAMDAAKEMIRKKLGEMVVGIVDQYSDRARGSHQTPTTQRKTKELLKAKIEGMLDITEKVCEKQYLNNLGTYDAYYTIQISKARMKEELQKAAKEAGMNEERAFRDAFDETFNRLSDIEGGD